MRIYVCWTPDGPIYFSAAREASIGKARDAAAEMVIQSGGERWDAEDIDKTRDLRERRQWDELRDHLEDIGALRSEDVRS